MGLARRQLRHALVRLSAALEPLSITARAAIDVGLWALATTVATALRLGSGFDEPTSRSLAVATLIMAALQMAIGSASGLYRRKWLYGSFEEIRALVLAATLTSVGFLAINHVAFDPRHVPHSAVVVGGVFGLVLMAGVRYVWRLIIDSARRPDGATAERLLVYGAGDGGYQAIGAMLRNPESQYLPVGVIDDDPAKRRMRLHGVPVVGTIGDLASVVASTQARALLLAMPSASATTISRLATAGHQSGLSIKVLPALSELVDGQITESLIRDPAEEDLLGRHQIDTDLDQVAGYLTGRRVLVTGAGGSIGSELCRQITRLSPAALFLLDRDESALHQVSLSLHGNGLFDIGDVLLADIRDASHLHACFMHARPDVVFHAAALKHLPLLEQFPAEATKTNVVGTTNVLDAATACGARVVVNISTDKAAKPISELGRSKLAAERLTADHAAQNPSMRCISVRFGNVLGSRGSVLTGFRAQIANGGPVTVTDPDVTRYFMTVAEAVQLVIQAGAIGETGETLVLDMGEPVRIADVAEQMIRWAGSTATITYTGLRPGEKLHEDLFNDGEIGERPKHKLITHVRVTPGLNDPA
jgi:FlaA1/EpsC-like NDP-sugar epimerase